MLLHPKPGLSVRFPVEFPAHVKYTRFGGLFFGEMGFDPCHPRKPVLVLVHGSWCRTRGRFPCYTLRRVLATYLLSFRICNFPPP